MFPDAQGPRPRAWGRSARLIGVVGLSDRRAGHFWRGPGGGEVPDVTVDFLPCLTLAACGLLRSLRRADNGGQMAPKIRRIQGAGWRRGGLAVSTVSRPTGRVTVSRWTISKFLVWLDGVVDLPSLPYCTILDGAWVWVVFLTPVITVRPLLAGPCNTESSVLQGVETGENGSD